jgi:hypothetical protein
VEVDNELANFRDLPGSFKIGQPLPMQPPSRKKHLTPALSPERRGRIIVSGLSTAVNCLRFDEQGFLHEPL